MISINLDFYWFSVVVICVVLAGQWAFRRFKSLFTSR